MHITQVSVCFCYCKLCVYFCLVGFGVFFFGGGVFFLRFIIVWRNLMIYICYLDDCKISHDVTD